MSTASFVDALIGLAREHKKRERSADALDKRAAARGKISAIAPLYRNAFGRDVADRLADSGYFHPASAAVFGDALEELLQNSTPARKKK